MKLVLRFLVMCSLLLMGAIEHPYAHSKQDDMDRYLAQLERATICLIKPSPTSPQSRTDRIIISDNEQEEKEEDDERNVFKTQHAIGTYLATFFYQHLSSDSGDVPNRLLYAGYFPFALSDRYIVLRVIRV